MITKNISKYPMLATYYMVAGARSKSQTNIYLHFESGIFTMNKPEATFFESEKEAEDISRWCQEHNYCGEGFFFGVLSEQVPVSGIDIKKNMAPKEEQRMEAGC